MRKKPRAATCPYCGARHSKRYLCEAEFESCGLGASATANREPV